MKNDPLIATALLGTASMTHMPPAPAPALEDLWSAIGTDNPAESVLRGLAMRRALHRAGMKPVVLLHASSPCPPEPRQTLPHAAVDVAKRLLSGEFTEVLPEWLTLALGSGRVMPARAIPALLEAAGKDACLRTAAAALVGERGLWLARRHARFSWLLGHAAVDDAAWDIGQPAERLAWLRQTRNADPAGAAATIASHWAGEDAAMREAIVRIASEHPHASDASWLENLALKDRRQDVRELATVALSGIATSAFHARALERVRGRVKNERRLLKRMIAVEPPAAYDPAWAADGIKEKPPQGIGEKAWWLRQMIALVPLDAWLQSLEVKPDELFQLARDKDWQEPLLLGWIDSALRMPGRAMPHHVIPFLAALEPWPPHAAPKGRVLQQLLAVLSADERFQLLDAWVGTLPVPLGVEIVTRSGAPPAGGGGKTLVAWITQVIANPTSPLTRPDARALALCIPPAGIRSQLEAIAKLPELSANAEAFANTLEFRQAMISHFSMP